MVPQARTIVDLLARRERFKKQIVASQMEDAGLDQDLETMITSMSTVVMDLEELSTDKDDEEDVGASKPPSRADIPLRSRRHGPPRVGRGEFALIWPETALKNQLKRDREDAEGALGGDVFLPDEDHEAGKDEGDKEDDSAYDAKDSPKKGAQKKVPRRRR